MGRREWLLLIALSVLWGGSFFFNGLAVRELPSFTIVTLRVLIAAASLLIALRLLGQRMPSDGRTWGAFLCMGFLNNALPFVLIVWGQHRIASGLAAILNATTPMFTALAAHWLTHDERLSVSKIIGILVGFGGVAVMIGADAIFASGGPIMAELACVAGPLSYALAGIYGRRFRGLGIAPLVTATGQLCAATVLLVPVALLVDRPWTLPLPHGQTWAAVAGLGLLSTPLAYWLYFRILAVAGATNVLLVTFLIPVTSVLLGTLVLDERLAARHFLGMALIGAGLIFTDGRLPRRIAGLR